MDKWYSLKNTLIFRFLTFPLDQSCPSVCQYRQPVQLLFIKAAGMTNGFAYCWISYLWQLRVSITTIKKK